MGNRIATLDQLTGSKIAGVDIRTLDVLELNFFAAAGLPGTEKSDLDAWLAKRDEMAARVRFEVCRHLYQFDPRSQAEPTEFTYGNSLGRFICWIALQVLQEDCGVKYHPDRKFKPDFCKPRDIFAHGIMDDDGEGGTCTSMPVVYVSVLRRLGLPVFLVSTRGHAFCRWDDSKGTTIRWANPNLVLWIPQDRFNIEGSGEGIAFHPDAYYTGWPEQWTQFDIDHGRHLRSHTAKEALAQFLMERGECFWDLRNSIEALRSYHFARQLVPDNQRYNNLHALRSRQYLDSEASMREIEDRIRKVHEQQFVPGEHPIHCKCNRCQAPKVSRWQPPPHGQSCQCFTCSQARELAMQPAGIPGHPTTCQCSGCLMQREMPYVPGQPAFGIANHLPHHSIPGQSIPGYGIISHAIPNQVIAGLPGF